jgi:hypothetical protein
MGRVIYVCGCPVCGAQKGQNCHRPDGGPMRIAHKRRRELASMSHVGFPCGCGDAKCERGVVP